MSLRPRGLSDDGAEEQTNSNRGRGSGVRSGSRKSEGKHEALDIRDGQAFPSCLCLRKGRAGKYARMWAIRMIVNTAVVSSLLLLTFLSASRIFYYMEEARQTELGLASLRKQIFDSPGGAARFYERGAAGAAEARDSPDLFTETNRPKFVPVVMIAATRPYYLKRVLASLEANERAGEVVLIVSQDGSNAETAAVIDSVTAMPVVRLSHPAALFGLISPARTLLDLVFSPDVSHNLVSTSPVAFNAHYVFEFAFEALHAQAAIYLEEDILPFPDALRFFLGSYELLTDASKFVVPGTNEPGVSRVFSVHSDSKFTYVDPDTGKAREDNYAHIAEPCKEDELCLTRVNAHGFMVFGRWWPNMKAGWTRWASWDICLGMISARAGTISLSTARKFSAHIGMCGIDFGGEGCEASVGGAVDPVAALNRLGPSGPDARAAAKALAEGGIGTQSGGVVPSKVRWDTPRPEGVKNMCCVWWRLTCVVCSTWHFWEYKYDLPDVAETPRAFIP